MDLDKYDGKLLRLTTVDGEVFEGIGVYFCRSYCEHEYGRQEDCLQIVNWLFFPCDISSIEDLEEKSGPYGGFSAPWGLIEEQNVREGVDTIQDVLESEEPVNVRRMLACLDRFLDPREGLPFRDEVIALLRHHKQYLSEEARREAEMLIEKWGSSAPEGQ